MAIFCILVGSNTLLSKELVKGGDLDTIMDYLVHIEGHHENLETFQGKLESVVNNAQTIFNTETIMETAVDLKPYKQGWELPPNAPERKKVYG